jgi:bile acid:Na+ symporter, BASS family
VVGPALAYLLTKVLPLAEPHASGLFIFSLAPIAPFLPVLVRKARADMNFSAALMPLAMAPRSCCCP